MSQKQTLIRTCPTSWRENNWHRCGMEKLRRYHPMYRSFWNFAYCKV